MFVCYVIFLCYNVVYSCFMSYYYVVLLFRVISSYDVGTLFLVVMRSKLCASVLYVYVVFCQVGMLL